MTTANLSVGLNTTPALDALRAFKTQARAEMRDFKLEVAVSMSSSVKDALKGKLSAEVEINGKGITSSVRTAVLGALDKPFDVLINVAGITAQIQAAVKGGMAGAQLPAGGPGVTSAGPVDMKTVVTQIGARLADAVASATGNEVAKAAQKIAGQKGGPSGSVGFSATDPETGMRVGVRESVDPNLAMRRALELGDAQRQADAAKAGAREENDLRNERLRKQRDENAAWDAYNAQQRKARSQAFDAAERDSRSKVSQDQATALKAQIRERVEAERAGLSSAKNYFESEKKIQDEILGLKREQKASFAAARAAAAEQRSTQAGEAQSVRSRNGAFDALDRTQQTQKKAETEAAWALQEAERKANAQRAVDLERLATVAATTRAKEAAERDKATKADVAAFTAAEAEKEAAQKNSASRTKTLINEAQRAANDTWQSIKNWRRSEDSGVLKDVRFVNPGQANDIKLLEGQLKTLAQAEELIGRGRADLAIRQYGQEAVNQVKNIDALKQKLLELQAVAKAANNGNQGPSAEALMRRQMANARASAETDARSQGLSGQDVKRAGAAALVGKFGQEAAGAFVNNDALMRSLSLMDGHAKKVETNSMAYRRWRESMNDAHSAARGLAGSLGMLWTTWGNTAPIIAAAAIGAALRSVFMVGKDVEYQLQFVSALTGGSVVSIEKFGNAVRGSLVMPKEAAEAMRGLAQNGLSVQQSLTALPAILNLATAGEMGLSEAALGATGVMAAFNLQVTDLGHIGDVFAKAASLSNTSVTGMVEAMKQASTVSDQYKVSLEETAATLATLAKRNITGTAAGTAFRNMMTELATPHQKAKVAMKELGLQLYDNSNQLKEYGVVLGSLREKLSVLNERSRLTFLNEIFGERGAKAANSLLSDFDRYSDTLKRLKEESQDFALSVTKALQDTTQGKMKALMSEFQLSSMAAFEGAKSGIDHFIDSLRAAVASDAFQMWLGRIVNGVTSLTSALVDNAGKVALTVGAWMAMRTLVGLYEGFMALKVAMLAAGAAASTASLAIRTVFGAATGTLGLVLLLGLEFVSLKRSVGEAEEAQKSFADHLNIISADLKREHEALEESNNRLARRNQLMRDGVNGGQGLRGYQADRVIQDEEDATKKNKLSQETEAARRTLAAVEAELARVAPKNITGGHGVQRGPETLEEARRLAIANLNAREQVERDFQRNVKDKTRQEEQTEYSRRLDWYKEFNADLVRLEKDSKGKIKTGHLQVSELDIASPRETYEKFVKDRKEALNNLKVNKTVPNPDDRSNDLAGYNALVAAMNNARRAMEQEIRLREQLDALRFDEKTVGPEVAALLAERRALEGSQSLKKFDEDWRKALMAAGASPNFKAADRINIGRAVSDLDSRMDLASSDLAGREEIAKAKSERNAQRTNDAFNKLMARLRGESAIIMQEVTNQGEKKYVDPGLAARRNAELKVEEKFQSSILDLSEALANSKTQLAILNAKAASSSGVEAAKNRESADAVRREVDERERELDAVKELRDLKKTEAGGIGQLSYERSLTAAAGMQRYWNEYKEAGKDSADYVYSAMKSSTDNMGRAIETFATTGKFSIKDMVTSMIADLARLAAQSAWRQIMPAVVNAISGASFSSSWSTAAAGTGATNANTMAGLFANGGVMTSAGSLNLRRYASGGVANSPQVAIYGEGRKPEAYVPLEDGRTIPVTVDAPTGGGGNVTTISFNPVIQIDSRSDQGQVGMLVRNSLTAYHEELMNQLKERGVV